MRGPGWVRFQLGAGARDRGRFVLYVPGDGYYSGFVPLTASGSHEVHLVGDLTTTLHPVPLAPSTTVPVRMNGVVDAVRHNAVVEVWIAARHLQLHAADVDRGKAAAAAQAAVDALIAENWTTIYGMLASSIQARFTEERFIAIMSGQSAPRIIRITDVGAGQISDSVGSPVFDQPVDVQERRPDGTMDTYRGDIRLVLEPDHRWHLLSAGPS